MLEARSYYGYYGPAGGYTGEREPGANGTAERYYYFDFEPDTKNLGIGTFQVLAENYKEALRKAEQLAKNSGCKLSKPKT